MEEFGIVGMVNELLLYLHFGTTSYLNWDNVNMAVQFLEGAGHLGVFIMVLVARIFSDIVAI